MKLLHSWFSKVQDFVICRLPELLSWSSVWSGSGWSSIMPGSGVYSSRTDKFGRLLDPLRDILRFNVVSTLTENGETVVLIYKKVVQSLALTLETF